MRNNSLDTFRLFAAFAVILMHVGYGNLPSPAENNIRLLGRFAVPFFFLISGYFFFLNYQKDGDRYFLKTLQRILGIFIVACLVYLLIRFQRISFSFTLLYEGTNYHLWFLSSLILGLIVCWYHHAYLKLNYVMAVVSVAIIVLYLLSDSYAAMLPNTMNKEFCRYLLSIPFVYCGAVIARKKYKLSVAASVILILSGVFLQIAESQFLFRKYGYNPFDHQVLAGTIPFALGMFFLSFNGFKNDLLAELGRKFSLSIYVYHQFVNFFLFKAIKFLFKGYADTVFVLSPLVSFCFTLFFLMAIDRYFPRLFAILNGEIKSTAGIFRKNRVSFADDTPKNVLR